MKSQAIPITAAVRSYIIELKQDIILWLLTRDKNHDGGVNLFWKWRPGQQKTSHAKATTVATNRSALFSFSLVA